MMVMIMLLGSCALHVFLFLLSRGKLYDIISEKSREIFGGGDKYAN